MGAKVRDFFDIPLVSLISLIVYETINGTWCEHQPNQRNQR